MTRQEEVINDPKYIPILDHGFVGLVDHMGNDSAIVQAARVSYGDGTKQVNEDRGLIRYLLRHKHTTPFEMCEVKFHLKLPIFIMRQLIRHRTANVNEYSGRYSIMTNEFYVPAIEDIKMQSQTNRQGGDIPVDAVNGKGVQWLINAANDHSYKIYEILLGNKEHSQPDGPGLMYEPYTPVGDDQIQLLTDDFSGISRELSRMVLGVNNYTECYWKCDLHNLFHFCNLRLDSHAQYEIRVLAEAMYSHIKSLYPVASEAFEDYIRQAKNLSRMEINLLQDLLHIRYDVCDSTIDQLNKMVDEAGGEKELAQNYGLSLREFREFRATWKL